MFLLRSAKRGGGHRGVSDRGSARGGEAGKAKGKLSLSTVSPVTPWHTYTIPADLVKGITQAERRKREKETQHTFSVFCLLF